MQTVLRCPVVCVSVGGPCVGEPCCRVPCDLVPETSAYANSRRLGLTHVEGILGLGLAYSFLARPKNVSPGGFTARAAGSSPSYRHVKEGHLFGSPLAMWAAFRVRGEGGDSDCPGAAGAADAAAGDREETGLHPQKTTQQPGSASPLPGPLVFLTLSAWSVGANSRAIPEETELAVLALARRWTGGEKL